MASKLLHIPVTHTSNPSHSLKRTSTLSRSFSFTTALHLQHHLLTTPHDKKQKQQHPKPRIPNSSPRCDLSKSPPKPPASKEEAILQAKTALTYALQKHFTNPRLEGKLKILKPPMLRVEIPVGAGSTLSISELAIQVFGEMRRRKKGSNMRFLFLSPNSDSTEDAIRVFGSHLIDIQVGKIDASVLDERLGTSDSFDVVVFLGPGASQLEVVKAITEDMYPRPVVILNPSWEFDEESGFGEMSSFVGSFEVVYSIAGLEVQGFTRKRTGVVMKYVRDGVPSSEKWNIFFQEEEGGELRLVSSFKKRPSVKDMENVLYNVTAMNSPITKSVKFLTNLVSNVIGKK